MTTDASRIAVDPAVRRPLGDISAGADTFTQSRVERILQLVVSAGCLVLGTQSFLNALGSTQEARVWHGPLMVIAFLPLALMVLALMAGRFARSMSRLFAVAFPVVLALWPIATAARSASATDEPWIWYLLNVATAAAVMAFHMPLQVVWAVGVPVLFGVARLAQLDFDGAAIGVIALDVVFAVILGAVIVALGWMLRAVAIGIDEARARAVASYAAAAAADAAEKERVAVAALMHDSVLAALIAAERADTERERVLAVAMAREALTRLANADQDAGEGSDAPVSADAIAARLAAVARDAGLSLEVARDGSPREIPGRVAGALVLAAAQAIANAVQHADGAGLAVTLSGDESSIRIVVSDSGPGFEMAAIPDDRLGIRGSILARMAAVAGRALIDSGPTGTVVALSWELPQ